MTQAYNLAILANAVNTSGQLNVGTNATGTLPVANGGTGATTLTANNVLLGNGTSALQAVAPSTNGNVLTSNGTTWVSSAPGGGGFTGARGQVFTSSGTFTIPTGVTAIKATIVGGGGNGASVSNNGNVQASGGGGGGGVAYKWLTGLTSGNTISVTVGGATGASNIASGTQSITTVTANGGSSSSTPSPNNSSSGGAGGTTTNADIGITGGRGGSGAAYTNNSDTDIICSGAGGGAGGSQGANGFVNGTAGTVQVGIAGTGPFGTGGRQTSDEAGQTGTGFGNGGSGASMRGNTSRSAGAGLAGVVIIEW
jgi:hypothetical protein